MKFTCMASQHSCAMLAHLVCDWRRQDMEARLLAEKLQLAATTKEERAELANELDKLKAERLAAVQVNQRVGA